MYYVVDEDLKNALQESVDYLTGGKIRFFPYNADIGPPDSLGLWLVEYTTSYELRKLTAKWTRTPSGGVAQDAAMCTFHFVNITAGVPDATWTTADYTSVETAFDTFWTTLKAYYAASTKLAELTWKADGPAFRPFGSSLSPTLRTVSRSVVGTLSGGGLPPQVAVTVTETTAAKFTVENVEGFGTQLRNRWGRYYLPALAVAGVTDGRLTAATQTAISGAAGTFYNSCASAGIYPVVYSPTTGHSWTVLEVHVDDIFDVIRSRRFITPLSRAPVSITQPT